MMPSSTCLVLGFSTYPGWKAHKWHLRKAIGQSWWIVNIAHHSKALKLPPTYVATDDLEEPVMPSHLLTVCRIRSWSVLLLKEWCILTIVNQLLKMHVEGVPLDLRKSHWYHHSCTNPSRVSVDNVQSTEQSMLLDTWPGNSGKPGWWD